MTNKTSLNPSFKPTIYTKKSYFCRCVTAHCIVDSAGTEGTNFRASAANPSRSFLIISTGSKRLLLCNSGSKFSLIA